MKEYTPQIVESEFFEWFETEIAKHRTDERLYVSASNLYNRLKTTGCHDVALVNDLERENLKRYLAEFKPDALDIQRTKPACTRSMRIRLSGRPMNMAMMKPPENR